MVSPCDVPRVISLKQVHDAVRARTTVVYITQYVQLVDGKTLDDIGNGHDEVVGTTCGNDGVDNYVDIVGLVLVFRPLVEQFLNDVGEVLRQ